MLQRYGYKSKSFIDPKINEAFKMYIKIII